MDFVLGRAEEEALQLRLPALIPVLLLGASLQVPAQEAELKFKEVCSACHTIGGGRLVGPDLMGVSERQDRAWLVKFIVDPAGVLASGDPYAQELLAASNKVPMIPTAGMTAEMAGQILDYIEAQSGVTVAAPPEVIAPFTAAEAQQGESYFHGGKGLRNGGPACISCHTLAGLSGWGGGRLGPDLTKVFERYAGARGIKAWLENPVSAVMTPVFAEQSLTKTEIRALSAYLEQAALSEAETAEPMLASFFLSGLLLAAALLGLFGFLWRNRYRATRTPMVMGSKR